MGGVGLGGDLVYFLCESSVCVVEVCDDVFVYFGGFVLVEFGVCIELVDV